MNHLRIFALTMAACSCFAATAYDFCEENRGTVVFYNITGNDEAEVTHSGMSALYGSYCGDVAIPSTVSYGGNTYRVTAVGDKAFALCTYLLSVNLPESVTTIGQRAFLGCSALAEIRLPSALEQIAASAFAWCDGLGEFDIPASARSIHPSAFDGCSSLIAINSDGGDFYASSNGILTDANGETLVAFPAGISGAYTVPQTVKHVGDLSFYGSALSEIKLPEGTESIGENAFYFSGSLQAVSVPASVTKIGRGAFADCFSLKSIDVDAYNRAYSCDEGLLLDHTGTELICCPAGVYDFPDIPAGVTTIAPQAFFRCAGMKGLRIPEGVKVIGSAAMIDCANLEYIEIPSTVTELGDMAFAQCASLQHVYMACTDPASVKTGIEVFANTPTDKCTLYVPVEALETYRFTKPWSDFAVIEGYKSLAKQEIEWSQNLKPESGDHATLSAKASSGLPVKYEVSPISDAYAVVNFDKVTFTEPGDVVIIASQAGNHQFLPAAPVAMVVHVKGTEGIDDVEADSDIRVSGSDGRIFITGAPAGATIRVYTLSGTCIYTGKHNVVEVNPGNIYIVRVAHRAFKIAV